MKRRTIVAAAALAALVVVAAAAASVSGPRSQKAGITVWLQVDAQSGWPDVVAAANAAFRQQHPGVPVDVQYQTWGTHLQKFDATLAGGNSPDVIEMGNTEMTKYMAAGAFTDISGEKASIPNSKTWLRGLEKSATYNGKLYGVPYYAGSRVVIFRTDQFKKAGITKAPTSLTELIAAGKKLMATFGKKNANYSALYIAGRDWYSAMSFVFDFGGQIARTKGGKWVGALDSPKAIQGLTAFKNLYLALSRASKTTDEAHPFPTTPFAQGQAAAFVGPGWQFGYALDPKAGNPKLKPLMSAFPMPSHVKGQTMPAFLGGSDLAIPAGANKQLALDWIKAFTSTAAMTALAKTGNIPNTTTLLGLLKGTPLSQLAAASKNTWFVPTAKNWTNVENAAVLQNMLTQILSGRLTVAAAARSASDNITSILNAT